jgi:diacylglycerol kinase (ATP)
MPTPPDLPVALLANPDSGRGEGPEAECILRERGAKVLRFTLDRAAEAAQSGAARIVVAGGDGSIGCAAEVAASAGVPLAVVPVGTANDFARALGIPLDPAEACRLAVAGANTRRLELAWIGSRPFVNAASAGLSPIAARKAGGLKRILGPLAYTAGALRAGLRARPIACRVSCERNSFFDGRAWQVSVAVTGAFGGGATVEADPHDGRLDVVVIEARSRGRLVAHAYRLRTGRVESQRGVRSRRCRDLEVRTDGETGFNVDGELFDARDARFRVEAGAFEVVTG